MRKRVAAVFTGILYAALVVSLLALQTKTIQGELTRLAANGLTLLLLIPTIFLFRMWLKAQNAGARESSGQSPKDEADAGPGESPQKSVPSVGREQFFSQMEEAGLSAREQEVAWLIYRGYSNRQIAEELYISEMTVKKHASHIYEKLQISGRKELKSCISMSHFL